MTILNVNVDTHQLEQWASELSTRGMRNAIRRAVDQSATAARRIALDTIGKDIGVAKARLKDAVGKVRRTTQTNLSASFNSTKARIGMLTTGATVSRYGGMSGSTFRVTGGGSANLHVKNAFVVNANGGRFVAIRRGKAKLPIKGIYAETPATAMGQPNAAARVMWTKAAEAEMNTRLPREIQRQFFSEKLSASTPDDTND